MKKIILSRILKAPFGLLGIASVIGAVYAGYAKLINGYGTAVLLAIIVGAYFWGEYLGMGEQ